MAVAGESVGGNMTAALALMAKQRGDVTFVQASMYYPVTDAAMDTASYDEFADGYYLSRDGDGVVLGRLRPRPRAAGRDHRVAEPGDRRAGPRAAADAPAASTRPTSLRDEGEAYAAKLRAAGVPVTTVRYDGIVHDFMLLNSMSETHATRAAIAQAIGVPARRARHGLRRGRRVRRLRRRTSCRPGGARVFARVGGSGPPLLLLHGYPQTHLMWHATAPLLAERYTVVVADLPGYGASFRPAPTPTTPRTPSGRSRSTTWRRWPRSATTASRWRGTTAAGGWPTGWPWTIPTGCSAAAVLDVVPTGEVWARADARWRSGTGTGRSSPSPRRCPSA